MRSLREGLRTSYCESTKYVKPGKYGRNRLITGLAQDISNLGEINFVL